MGLMKVTGWTYWDNDRYLFVEDMTDTEFEEATQAVVDEMREKGYKFHGVRHQHDDYCCPIIDNKWVYCVSMRSWGAIMQKAYDLPNEDGLGYVAWAWTNPNGETEILPEITKNGE